MLRAMGFVAALLAFASPAASQTGIGELIIYFNQRCGPLSGKLPDQFSKEDEEFCSGLATKANKILGLKGPGFELKPHVKRALDGEPVTILGGVQACDGSRHRPENASYIGEKHADRYGNIEVCTPAIPPGTKVTGLTCEAHGPKGNDGCVNNGNTNDCPWTATVQIYQKPDLQGSKFCWWVYNQSDKGREYSISIR